MDDSLWANVPVVTEDFAAHERSRGAGEYALIDIRVAQIGSIDFSPEKNRPHGARFHEDQCLSNLLVLPQIDPVLTDFCKKLTSIQQADVDGASTYVEVGRELGAFTDRYPDAAWASWGDYDARQLERDAGLAACPSLLSGLQHQRQEVA
ncbi:hypothetical protein [Pseudomonas sp. TSRC2-2]|uniref:hypothetical protein n=1 Tax=unclassified Pseudomonas TaxID=196821 RepID=UPI003CE9CE7B